MPIVPLFSDDIDAVLVDSNVDADIRADVRDIREYVSDFYGKPHDSASLHILEPDDVVIFWEDDAFSTSFILGGFEKEARVESGETGSSLTLSSSGGLKWVLDSLDQMRRILSFDV